MSYSAENIYLAFYQTVHLKQVCRQARDDPLPGPRRVLYSEHRSATMTIALHLDVDNPLPH